MVPSVIMKCVVCKEILKSFEVTLCIKCWEKGYTKCDNCQKYKTTKQMKYYLDGYYCSLKCLKEDAKIE